MLFVYITAATYILVAAFIYGFIGGIKDGIEGTADCLLVLCWPIAIPLLTIVWGIGLVACLGKLIGEILWK